MITIVIRDELWDEENEEFKYGEPKTINLEHSLVSISKWESKWCKPFLSTADKTPEEWLDYIRCMTITKNVSPETYKRMSTKNFQDILEYMNAPMTATTIRSTAPARPNREVVTSELIYYWMLSFRIPFECQKWHLNRLLTLIRVCDVKNQKPKKMSQREIASKYASLNAARKLKYNTKG